MTSIQSSFGLFRFISCQENCSIYTIDYRHFSACFNRRLGQTSSRDG